MQYKLISERNKDDLNNAVNHYMKLGWILYGSPSVSLSVRSDFARKVQHVQALIKEEEI